MINSQTLNLPTLWMFFSPLLNYLRPFVVGLWSHFGGPFGTRTSKRRWGCNSWRADSQGFFSIVLQYMVWVWIAKNKDQPDPNRACFRCQTWHVSGAKKPQWVQFEAEKWWVPWFLGPRIGNDKGHWTWEDEHSKDVRLIHAVEKVTPGEMRNWFDEVRTRTDRLMSENWLENHTWKYTTENHFLGETMDFEHDWTARKPDESGVSMFSVESMDVDIFSWSWSI